MAQQDWHSESITALFKTKSNFRRERKLCNAVYNGRSAFMKFNKLNVSSAKDPWDRLSQSKKLYWTEVARQLNAETGYSSTWDFCFTFERLLIPTI